MATADEDDITGLHDLSSEDEDYSYDNDDVSDNDTNVPANITGRKGQYSKKNSRNEFIEYTVLSCVFYATYEYYSVYLPPIHLN
jgi:hypothetical protein